MNSFIELKKPTNTHDLDHSLNNRET